MPVLPQSFNLNSPDWLKSLRWVAILGISATILGARLILPVSANWLLLTMILSALAIWNFSLPWLEEIHSFSSKYYVLFQIVVDLCVLTGILWLTGGLLNPFASFYIFHVMIAGLLLDRRLTIAVSLLTILFVLLLLAAEPLQVAGRPLVLRESPIWLGLPAALILLIIFATAFILGFLHRLERSQEESRQREKMAAMGRLVAGLAHELGTPLNVIMLLANDLITEVAESARKDLATITAQARRCGDLVALLLGYSRSTTANNSYKPVVLDTWLREVFFSAKGSLPPQTGENAHLEIINYLESSELNLPELVLRQVLWNLMRNSIFACAGQGRTGLVTVELRAIGDSAQLQFLIKDNGPGFTEEARDRAFEAFFSTKKPGDGDGLGLYMSYHLIQQLGGKITIPKDWQANGAVMEVLLPNRKELA